MKHYHHIVTNFDSNTPFWHKVVGNFMFLFGITKITFRGNLLTIDDYKKAKEVLQKGDIILVGQHKRISKYFIQGPVTHAALCVSKHRLVHALADGVMCTNLKKMIKEYDTLIILRPKTDPAKSKEITGKAIAYIKNQIGKPFNFLIEEGEEKFYCTELVNNAYRETGFDTGLANHKKFGPQIIEKIIKIKNPLRPTDFLKGNFEIIYMSEALEYNDKGEIVFTGIK